MPYHGERERPRRTREEVARRRREFGRIGATERRSRAIMLVPPKMKLSSQEAVTMMLISATSVSPEEMEAGVRAMQAAREGLRGDRAALLAALVAMGFEYRVGQL